MSEPCETLNEGASIYKKNRCNQFDLLHLLVLYLYFQRSDTFVLILGFCLYFFNSQFEFASNLTSPHYVEEESY